MAERQFGVSVRAQGPRALFTRPEFKVERVSYDVLPPTAAQGLLESILWKPEFRWNIHRIKILKPIRYQSIRRNEVKTGFPSRVSDSLPTLDITQSRIQRHSLLLRDVDYVIEASVSLTETGIESKQNPIKYVEMFRRRVERGQHFRVPNFGCREFVADVSDDTNNVQPITEDRVLGLMPLRIKWADGLPEPVFFAARMINGVLDIPVQE